MNIFLTFDYEIFFGERSGSVEKCIIDPTKELIKIAQTLEVPMTFFIDCGHLLALKKYSPIYPVLKKDLELITSQIKLLIGLGHACELHIHPHWEDAIYDGEKWIFDVRRYKLTDFSEDEILFIFKNYKNILEEITEKKIHIFRAGGWCLQPFSKIKKAFTELDIKIDSSVFAGGYLETKTHFYDFRKAPLKDNWRFTEDLCYEEEKGKFMEVPISSYKYSLFFFWKLYGFGRIFRERHKSTGNGSPVPSKGTKLKYLTSSQNLPISCDGYFASVLDNALRSLEIQGRNKLVIIGHPKASTSYSLVKLEKFISKNKKGNDFLTLSSLL
jgi:hypothetical protein